MKWICPKCNAKINESSGICTSCYALKPDDPAAVVLIPDSVDPAVASSPIPAGAGFGIRALARFLDTLVILFFGFAVVFLVMILFTILAHMGKLTPQWHMQIGHSSISGVFLALLGGCLYHALAEGIGSVSIGKLICGLRVVRLDGRPVGMGAAGLRSLAYHIDALFFGLVGYNSMEKSPLRQRYGDVWAKTVVVKRREFSPIEPRGGLRITTGILAGLFVWSGTLALDLVLKVV